MFRFLDVAEVPDGRYVRRTYDRLPGGAVVLRTFTCYMPNGWSTFPA